MNINWDAVGASGELAGAAGVILTLFYLARQIRESNRSARRASVQEVLNLNTDVMCQITSTIDSANIWAKGTNDMAMDTKDEIYFLMVLYSNVLLWERMFFLHEDGYLDEWIWDDVSRQIDGRVGSKRFQVWFNQFGEEFYNDRWRNFLTERIEKANRLAKENLETGKQEKLEAEKEQEIRKKAQELLSAQGNELKEDF